MGWDKNKLMKWLEDHPIAAADDVSFLKKEVANMARVVINAKKEKNKEKEQLLDLEGSATKYKSWTGRAPYLRLIHTLIDHDDIKAAYIHRGDIPSGRMAVENRNTEEAKAASVWQMMADKWNDKDFSPATASQPDWHPHYGASETITFEIVSNFLPPNAEKVKERFESMMTVLKRTIPKWERSGQGEGGINGDDDEYNNDDDKPGFGVLEGRSCFALSKIQDFFENSNSYVIYLWHMIAKHQLISSSMNMLAEGVGSRSGAKGIPSAIRARSEEENDEISVNSKTISSVSTGRKESDNHDDSLSRSIREHASSLNEFAKAKAESSRKKLEHEKQKEKRKRHDKLQLEIGRLQSEKRQFTIQMLSVAPGPQHDVIQNALASSIMELDVAIANNYKQLSDVDTNTPLKSNRSPEF